MSLTTPADYLEALRETLGEPEADRYQDTQLYRYLSWAAKRVWRYVALHTEGDWYVEAGAAISLVADQQEYDLNLSPPASGRKLVRFMGLERIHKNQDFMQRIAFQQRGRYEPLGAGSSLMGLPTYPAIYYLKPPYVGICNTPDANLANAVKAHAVWSHPDIESGGSNPLFAGIDVMERLTLIRAAMFTKHLDETRDSTLLGEWKDGLGEIAHDFSQGGDEPEYRERADDEDWD